MSEIKEYQYFAGGKWRSAESKKLFDVFRPYDRVVTHAPGAAGEIADVFFESPSANTQSEPQ